MPVDYTGFTLKPDGFFDRNPALDVPRTPASTASPGRPATTRPRRAAVMAELDGGTLVPPTTDGSPVPKLVDRDQRRQEILEVTWRLMASRGADAATMREIAREAGYANGALAPYFSNKDELVEAAYVYVFDRTNERIRTAVRRQARGSRAARLPGGGPADHRATRLEARIVLPFWNRAVTDERLARLNDGAFRRWRREHRRAASPGPRGRRRHGRHS